MSLAHSPSDILSQRRKMVLEIKEKYHLNSPDVLIVMEEIPRELFAPEKYRNIAYEDEPIPIGYGQTMSQPYTVAFMTDLVITGNSETKTKKVLEIGTGSGYQAAILSKLFAKVYTVEIVPELAKRAKKTLKSMELKNVEVKSGSGEWGWEENAPYDAIMVTAGLTEVPPALLKQLKVGGVLVAPVGEGMGKEMVKYTKTNNSKLKIQKYGIFNFVPFIKNTKEKDGL